MKQGRILAPVAEKYNNLWKYGLSISNIFSRAIYYFFWVYCVRNVWENYIYPFFTLCVDVASWREGGGRAVPQPKPEEPIVTTPNSTATEMQPNGPPMSGGGSGSGAGGELQPQSSLSTRPGPPHGAMPLGPHMGMPPQYRSMMPAFVSCFSRLPPLSLSICPNLRAGGAFKINLV